MAIRHSSTDDVYQRSFPPLRRYTRKNPTTIAIRKLQEHAPKSTLIGLMMLMISCMMFLILPGLTFSATVIGLVLFAPLVLISSPIWVPVGTTIFIVVFGLLSVCGFGVASVTALSWLYRYFRGFHPVGSDRVDYARTRIVDTASHVKDYAKQYGGYFQSKGKNAAPGA